MSVPDADEARRGWLAAVEVSDTRHSEVPGDDAARTPHPGSPRLSDAYCSWM